MADENIINGIKKALEDSPERNFDESLELAINLRDIDLSNPDNRVDEEIVLPNGRGKTIKVGVFGSGELALNARDSADTVIEPDEIDEIAEDKREARKLVEEHQFFLAEPPLMPVIGREMGAILGPKGKMPSPVTPNMDINDTINSLKNTVHVRSRDRMTFHAPIGTESMDVEDLIDNADTVIRRIIMNLERREMNIKSIYVKTTMGPAVRIM
ncbi:MAG: 50S ribosomal protein L1 [Thermoplasmatota archaeon]